MNPMLRWKICKFVFLDPNSNLQQLNKEIENLGNRYQKMFLDFQNSHAEIDKLKHHNHNQLLYRQE
ncbi:hypothetical protein DERF_014567 [Dermatophagoides farinae]|uniref:Uncharacterized protein n=1 Tax=Dermatophagoides farinae TaxID=6954 RepID=A0A922HJ19_DERFA|nr:hypothetical protein DERF_014552 [Dermatophagoides farinae]KAH9493838.1 hypothetical protein DERF_014567 [Dermatophagoides farinae]